VNGKLDLSRVSGLDLRLDATHLSLDFGPGIEQPAAERRTLAQVRPMLADKQAGGPEHLYTIYMDICRREDRPLLVDQGLLYGSVIYNRGILGRERLRSQSHVHAKKDGTGVRYSEVYEFWTGHGAVFLQKEAAPVVTRAYLVQVQAGDRLVIPCGWAHLVVTEGDDVLSFGAWCARANRLEYTALQALGGPCYYFPYDGAPVPNPRYQHVPPLIPASVCDLPALDIPADRPIPFPR
jgi:glucose-6-phosphate isomerase